MTRLVEIGPYRCGEGCPLLWILGPCVIESEEMTLAIARQLAEIRKQMGVQIVFKASIDKANRSSIKSFRGVGWVQGEQILDRVQEEIGLPITTDIHNPNDISDNAFSPDIIQIPALLCRQTDLVEDAAMTGNVVSVKKGQFMSPQEMANVVEKIRARNNDKILLIERGTTFGYNNLVVDMRSIPIMQTLGCPVIFDASHSLQKPGAHGNRSGGDRWLIPTLARAAVAAGADGLFIEVHPKPHKALSDPDTTLALDDLPELIEMCERIHKVVR